jgi:hypothetical protein
MLESRKETLMEPAWEPSGMEAAMVAWVMFMAFVGFAVALAWLMTLAVMDYIVFIADKDKNEHH